MGASKLPSRSSLMIPTSSSSLFSDRLLCDTASSLRHIDTHPHIDSLLSGQASICSSFFCHTLYLYMSTLPDLGGWGGGVVLLVVLFFVVLQINIINAILFVFILGASVSVVTLFTTGAAQAVVQAALHAASHAVAEASSEATHEQSMHTAPIDTGIQPKVG
eukprot:GHVQ01019668.1.p1 GENE.GHVQ01019668.1~~GHVQ01019668.1.p1  ORF type:complete len:162 (+),score=38.17 GHVQ01019668.1:562-1047(+)